MDIQITENYVAVPYLKALEGIPVSHWFGYLLEPVPVGLQLALGLGGDLTCRRMRSTTGTEHWGMLVRYNADFSDLHILVLQNSIIEVTRQCNKWVHAGDVMHVPAYVAKRETLYVQGEVLVLG